MLIENDFVKAEHQYRRHRLSELYPEQRRRRSSPDTATKLKKRWNQIVVQVGKAAVD